MVIVDVLIIEPVGEVMAKEEAGPPVLGMVDKVDEQVDVAVDVIITGSHGNSLILLMMRDIIDLSVIA